MPGTKKSKKQPQLTLGQEESCCKKRQPVLGGGVDKETRKVGLHKWGEGGLAPERGPQKIIAVGQQGGQTDNCGYMWVKLCSGWEIFLVY